MFSHTPLGLSPRGCFESHARCSLTVLFSYLPLCGQLDNGSQRYVRVVIDNRGIQLSAIDRIEHNPFALSITIIFIVIVQN